MTRGWLLDEIWALAETRHEEKDHPGAFGMCSECTAWVTDEEQRLLNDPGVAMGLAGRERPDSGRLTGTLVFDTLVVDGEQAPQEGGSSNMPREQVVEVYSAKEGRSFEVAAPVLRDVAQTELGMTDGPIELNIFTKTILATALQREQIVRADRLKAAMTVGGDWQDAMNSVAAVNDLMSRFGIESAKWTPTESEVTADKPKVEEAKAAEPDGGTTMALNLDGQSEIPF